MIPDNQNEEVTGENSAKQTPRVNYKFHELKVHASDEWMANGTKKYRKVYDRFETTYIRVEFSAYNRLFDEAEWEATFQLKCFEIKGSQKNELCHSEQKKTVGKEENIFYVRYSWGNDTTGDYWRKGDYLWEAYADGIKVGEVKFYVVDMGKSVTNENNFFEIKTAKFFEGPTDGYLLNERKYLKKFNQKETRFIWCEFSIKNKATEGCYVEIFFNYYDKAGLPKGGSPYLIYLQHNTSGQTYTLFPSWGSETPGRWKNDLYSLEVVFMDTLVATIPFQVGEIAEEGDPNLLLDVTQILTQASASPKSVNKHQETILNESLAELNSLTGLENIKTEINEMVKLVRFYQETGKDVLNKFSLHTVFTGNPGTGKTTVARIVSRIYQGLGILQKGHLVEVDREGLVAGYVGQTAIKASEKINEAQGGILFIDEAYSLAQGKGSQHDFGGEAIQVLLKRMEDLRGKFGVIVAGYTDNMQEFIESNPGLKSRFDKYFSFEDYTPADMLEISNFLFGKEEVKPDTAAAAHLKNYFSFLYASRDKHFGNARTVRQVVNESVKNQNLRLANISQKERTKEMLETIVLDDVKEFEIKELKTQKAKIGFQTTKE
jgi:SpoVK/Ycf46/Vps4 family AAA+-type ATPase